MLAPTLPAAQPLSSSPATRKLILEAAARVFAVRGYEASSMELIASESGAGRRTVYNHFRNKKELFEATTVLLWERMPVARMLQEEHRRTDPVSVLSDIGKAFADFWAEPDAITFLRLIINEGARFPELAASFYTFGRGPVRGAVADYFRAMDEAKVLSVPDAEVAAAQFIDLLLGAVLFDSLVLGRKPPSPPQRVNIVDEAVATILSRCRPPG